MEEFNSNNFSLWIGGYRDDSDTWYWVTGESWEYTNWGEGEPNDSSSVVPDERYVTLWPQQWNDLANTNVLEQSGFVCEWDCADDVPTVLPTQRPENTISPGVSRLKSRQLRLRRRAIPIKSRMTKTMKTTKMTIGRTRFNWMRLR